ncbi:B12-binding domain-containing radical SAM protein [Synechococcus sp. OH20]|uniref:B12-binding domain-containing radical SAM protein n=1 Tax=Synechococcus sp. OH20 TaxID=139337 RepID=UPI0039C5C7CA
MATSELALEQLLFTPATPAPDAVRVIYAFPNTYSVGITSLGYQVIWSLLASRREVAVARLFTDLAEPLPRDPELVGFSLSWELDYVHILDLLERQGIPLQAEAREEAHPLVFGGGPVLTANPEPFAAFFDLILLGDGEGLVEQMIQTYRQVRQGSRAEKLRALAQVPGIYVPSLYEVHYRGPDGPVEKVIPKRDGIPSSIRKHTFRGNTLSVSTVVTPKAAWESIYMVEVVRSCPEMCRFCLASYLTLPFRAADVEGHLIPAVERGLQVTQRIGLLGASVTQHPQFEPLLEYLAQDRFEQVRLSLASVRTGTVTPRLAQVLSRRGSQSITVAIESGSERLRRIVNKKLTNEEILAAAAHAQAGGLKGIKFYGMVGIPAETQADLEATVALFKELKKAAPRLRLTLGCSTFVPKAHTPFQWQGVDPQAEKKLQWYQKHLRPLGVEFRPESYSWSVIQALISRGDRRVARVLQLARQWGESLGSFRRAFKELKGQLPPLDYYVHSDWDPVDPLPWQHIEGPLTPERLLQHRQEAFSVGSS